MCASTLLSKSQSKMMERRVIGYNNRDLKKCEGGTCVVRCGFKMGGEISSEPLLGCSGDDQTDNTMICSECLVLTDENL